MPHYRDDLPLDQAITIVFADGDPAGVRKLLDEGGMGMPERVQLAVVLLSDGRFDQLRHFLKQARLDSRDVLYWAFSYEDDPPARLRHLLKP